MSYGSNKSHLEPVDTSFTFNVYDDSHEGDTSPAHIVHVPSPAHLSLSPTIISAQSKGNTLQPVRSTTNSRARNESRKLLSHVLLQLANRRKPVSVVDALTNTIHESSERGFGAIAVTLKEAVKGMKPEKRKERPSIAQGDDSDEEQDDTFSTDDTIDLMMQLEDLLTMSVAQGWQLFDDSSTVHDGVGEDGSKISSTFRRSRYSYMSGSKRSRSSSPSKGQIRVPELLSLCISILGSIVAEDCRYRVVSPRPSRPPNALQVLTLNIAQFLVRTHQHDPRVMSQIALAMIPAFSTFEPPMHPRLLTFFNTSIIRLVLLNLKQLQGQSIPTQPISGNEFTDPFEDNTPAVVSIQIEDVQGDRQPSQASVLVSSDVIQIQSTNNPHQPAQIYYLASIVPPLLSAIFDSIQVEEIGFDVLLTPTLGNILMDIASQKSDLYNDLLELVAFRGSKARRLAIASLAKLWPRAVGHAIISAPFCPPDIYPMPQSRTPDVHSHQFVPWFFDFSRNRINVGDILHDNCRSCSETIRGFGLVCVLCLTAVHSDCYDYPEGNSQIQYSMSDDLGVRRLGMYRFCDLQPNGDLLKGIISIHGHRLRPTNWFTLCLCYSCHKPLWGCSHQGLRCEGCSIPLHFKCLPSASSLNPCHSISMSSTDVTIDLKGMRQSCLNHFPVLTSGKEQLENSSHEEISTFRDVLRTQIQILDNGVLMGSIVISLSKSATLEFELHRLSELCEDLLVSGKLRCAPLTEQYMEDTNNTKVRPSTMFNPSYLEYIAASIKASSPQNPLRMASGFLNVEHLHNDQQAKDSVFPYERVRLSHVRNILGVDFAFQSDDAAHLLINHLHSMAYMDRNDHHLHSFTNLAEDKNVECIFPLPLGLDLSLNVETLVSAIESCLGDLNLSTNEFGFLLLSKRFWPNGLASEYALTRLAGKVFLWILDEDDKLAVILREFVAKQSNLPGMRTARNTSLWPSQSDFRSGPSSNSSNGGDFVVARRALLSRYAIPWLLELHDLDPPLYCRIAFEICLQVANDKDFNGDHQTNPDEQAQKHNDNVLRGIIKLCQTSVIFTAFDAILQRSMQLIAETNPDEKPSPSIYKLFATENETAHRGSTFADFSGQPDRQNTMFMDSFRVVLNLAKQSSDGLSHTLSILPVIVKSGVNISSTFFQEILALISPDKPDFLNQARMFIRALSFCLWLRSLGRQDLQIVIASLHAKLSSHILLCMKTGNDAALALSVVRYSLAGCLLIYGCERPSIIAGGFISQEETDLLPSRRRFNVRASGVTDPVYIDPSILSALHLYTESNVEDLSCLTAKFLHLFIAESPFLEPFEIDNFVLQNAKLVAMCVWAAYDNKREDIAAIRTHLLLRSVMIDAEPFEDILRANLDPTSSPIEQRLSCINRIFRIVSDVTSPAFFVEGRQWRSSVIEIFYLYFSSLWSDPSEEVRLAVKVSSTALLPAHFEIISQCWNEALSKAPITERIRLLGFLIQLRPHFTSWKVLSWESIMETLTEYDYDPKSPHSELNAAQQTVMSEKEKFADFRLSIADPDMAHLRVSLLLLSLQMIGDSIDIDSFSLMKLKVQFVQITGFSRITVIPSQSGQSFYLKFGDVAEISESALPCIEELVHVVDSAHYVTMPHSALGLADDHEGKSADVLVGAVFVDASLCMLSTLRDLTSLPVLTLKSILEALYIICHKYDFEDPLFLHLQLLLRRAVLRAVEVLSKDELSYELRQLALSIAQTCIKKWHTFLGATVPIILDIVATEVAAQARHNQDPLVIQGKLLIGSTLHTFCQNGLLLSIMRRPLQPEFFTVLKQVLAPPSADNSNPSNLICDPLLRDTLTRVVDVDAASLQTVLQNICTFVEVVHFQGYTFDMIIFTGQLLTQVARRMSDGTIEGADPAPLIKISVTLMQHNKKHARDFLPYLDTVLRVSLNRLYVTASVLNQLVQAELSNRSKNETSSGPIDIINVLFEVLLDGLRMKTKMLPLTVKSLTEALLSAELYPSMLQSGARERLFQDIVDDSYNFLQNHVWSEDHIDNEFNAVSAAATLFLHETNRNPSVLYKFIEPIPEKLSRPALSIRSWNMLLLVTLQEGKEDWAAMLYSHFNAFGHIFASVMRSYSTSGISSILAATTDVNQAHIAMKLWLMLANSRSTVTGRGETLISATWNELWATYEGFLDVLDTEAQVGLYPTLISLAATSVADLLIYIRALKTSLALDTASQLTILSRLKAINRGDASSSKIHRAIRSLSEPPPEIATNILLDQIAKEMVAAEKIRVVESKRAGDNSKMMGDRSRKDGR